MKAGISVHPTVVLLALLVSGVSLAEVGPITSVEAGQNGSPPYMLESVTVGNYTVTAELLATGHSTGSTTSFLWPITRADDLDLNNATSRDHTSDPWRITMIDDQETWIDRNGENPDFFLFEVGMDDAFIVQAIFADGALGQGVTVQESNWGATDLHKVYLPNLGQPIGGLAFAITDLLDADGLNLTHKSTIRGIQITSNTIDPASFSAVVPEPATITLLGLGGLMMLRQRRRQ